MRRALPLLALLTFPLYGFDVACSPQYPPAESARRDSLARADSARAARLPPSAAVSPGARSLSANGLAAPARRAAPGVLPLSPSAPLVPGGLVVPVAGVPPGALADTYTDARSEGRVHNAIDIMAPTGTPVVAAAPGRVARLFTSERGGLTVYVLGEDARTVYYYSHLDAYAPGLAEGQALRAGEAVGTVGETGNVAPGSPHLHFAIWTIPAGGGSIWTGEPVNPYPLLRGTPPAATPAR